MENFAEKCIFYLPYGHSHLPPTVQHSQLIPRVQFLLVGDQCKMITIKHQPVTTPENARPPRDLEMSNLGGFGPNILVSAPSDNEPALLPSAAVDFAFHVTRSKVHSTTWQKIRLIIFIHPLWTSTGMLVMVTLE